MKRLLVLLIMFTGFVNVTHGQQEASDSIAILGEWNIFGVQAEMYSQQDGILLEKRSTDPRVEDGQLKMGIPQHIRFTEDSCFLGGREAIAGGYDLIRGGLLRVKQVINSRIPAIMKTYQYVLAPGVLTLTLPSVYYQDTGRGEAVKVVYQCQYKRN
ncbi:hypothetical protein [Chitinophaga ginsengisoli]|uniref:Lipocalin-like protein n=1 Tax=Chitinophaga ginsengisoli TaxID=363837 RepID=A0A2P8GKE4_9BACT|nr:hypothetical protein [Chitinophaga ginsengisoli]PSL34433.1 hypothetical protein CLV42_1024 [Chitinophaga ginsengisoli]